MFWEFFWVAFGGFVFGMVITTALYFDRKRP